MKTITNKKKKEGCVLHWKKNQMVHGIFNESLTRVSFNSSVKLTIFHIAGIDWSQIFHVSTRYKVKVRAYKNLTQKETETSNSKG